MDDRSEIEKVLPNGDLYIGSLMASGMMSPLPEGRGKYLWSDGCMYEGTWSKGKKMGVGKLSWPSGATYEGEFMGGCLHGYGTYTGIDGATFKGQWSCNHMHGIGRKSYANGDIYEGHWRHGLPEGEGRYAWSANGNEYFGHWRRGRMSGKGIMRWSNGDKYDGQWHDGLPHGHGLYRWAQHGSLYVGSWYCGLKHGKGLFYPNKLVSSSSASSPSRSPIRDIQSQQQQQHCNQYHRSQDDAGDSFGSSRRLRREASVASASEHEYSCGSFDAASSKSFTDRIPRRVNSFDTEKCSTEDSLDSSYMTEFEESEDGSSVCEADDAPFLVSEREYSQGVLVSEVIKENFPPRAPRNKPRRPLKETRRQGEVIFKGHRNYDLMLNLQLGIRYTVGRITPEPKRDIVSADFGPKARIWMRFPPEGSASTPPHQSIEFKWKDYCPLVFRNLRELFQIDAADYMLSVCGNDALREFSSPGKSGSMFYLSNDNRYMIKTMRKHEVKMLLRMLPNYYKHCRTYRNTLVTKFFGVHAIKPAGGQKVRFVAMNNVFCSEVRIHRRYDLKGSSQGRLTERDNIRETTTLKDLDLDYVFHLEPSWRRAVIKQIEQDCKLLEEEKIMDYSLLLGVHLRAPHLSATFSPTRLPDNRSQQPELLPAVSAGSHPRGSYMLDDESSNEIELEGPQEPAKLWVRIGGNMPARARPKRPRKEREFHPEMDFTDEYDVVLYFGIIDILQEYDMSKKLEHAYKSLQFDPTSISAVDPKQYSKRFQEFISRIFPKEY